MICEMHMVQVGWRYRHGDFNDDTQWALSSTLPGWLKESARLRPPGNTAWIVEPVYSLMVK